MCLYIGNKDGFITKKEIKVYKVLIKHGNEYVTPSQRYLAEIGKELIPANLEPSIDNCGYKYALNGGAIHAYLDPNQALGSYSGEVFVFEATIPEGTRVWIQDDLNQVAASRIFITKNRIGRATEELFLESAKPLIDQFACDEVRLKNGQTVPFSTARHNPGDVVGIKVGKYMVSTEFTAGVKFAEGENGLVCRTAINDWDKAKKDMSGEKNTKGLIQNNPKVKSEILDLAKKVGGYIPAMGELTEVFKDLAKLNLTRVALGLERIPFAWFWTSTMRDSTSVWRLNSGGRYYWGWYYYAVSGAGFMSCLS